MHGAITGHVAVGRYVLHIGEPLGALVSEAPPDRRTQLHPLPTPILLRPRSIRGLFGRDADLAAILSALDGGLPIEVSGEPGIGKTALLRSVAYHPSATAFTDGILYLAARQQSSADLLQQIFDAFFDSDEIRKPTTADIRRAFQDTRALILVDDVHLKREELEQLLDAAPRCGFVFATRERRLFSEVRHIPLKGLSVEHAILLLERELARPLEDRERSGAANLCATLDGHPLRILQAAAVLRDRGASLDVPATEVAPESLIVESLASIDQKHRRIVLVLAAIGAPLQAQHVAGIAEIGEIDAALSALVHRGLVLSTASGHRLADGVADRIRRTDDLNPWLNRAITYYTAWAERYRRDRERLLEESEPLLRVQQHAINIRRWGEALRIARVVEGALVTGVRWDAWATALDHALTAAKAIGDRSVEAWALHEIGTRAVCAGETRAARAALSEALKLRESLRETAAADASRRNLSFVLAPAFEPAPESTAVDDRAVELDSLPLQDGPAPAARIRRTQGDIAFWAASLLVVLSGGFACWALAPPDWRASSLATVMSVLPRREAAATDAPATPPAARAWTDTSVQQTPIADPGSQALTSPAQTTDRPNILIFSPRPSSFATGPTKLCYAVAGAVSARVEPGIGDVAPTSTLTCLRVVPSRTTTYQLTALGRSGDQVRQQLVIVVR